MSPRLTKRMSGETSCEAITSPKPSRARERRRAPLVRGMPEAVHEDDRDALDAARARGARGPAASRASSSGRSTSPSARDALVGLDDVGVERRRQLDAKVEEPRPVLVADRERVAEARRRDERGRHAAALEQRVGRDRRADANHVDARVGAAFAREQRRGCPATPGSVAPPSSDRRLATCRRPSGARPMMSVNVPPRSIQNCQPRRCAHAAQDSVSGAYTFRSCSSAPPARRSQASR